MCNFSHTKTTYMAIKPRVFKKVFFFFEILPAQAGGNTAQIINFPKIGTNVGFGE